MAALLVSLAVMAVLMSVALPVWRHEMQREKEAELVWRGQQYMRAIRLFQARTQTLPTSIDLLVQGHYLRKKYKDPITNDDFELVGAGGVPGQTSQPGQAGQPGRGGAPTGGAGVTVGGGRGSFSSPATPFSATTSSSTSGTAPSGTVAGGMMGVRSKSKSESIRLYLGRNHYNEWQFLFVNQQPGGQGGRGQPGGPGGPGGRGQPTRPGAPPGGGPGPGRGPGSGATPGRGGAFPFPPGGGGVGGTGVGRGPGGGR